MDKVSSELDDLYQAQQRAPSKISHPPWIEIGECFFCLTHTAPALDVHRAPAGGVTLGNFFHREA
jgi:hypothetical protein